jgi:hypothetical protein
MSETRRSRVYWPYRAMEQSKHKGGSVRRTTAKVYRCEDEGRYGLKSYKKQGCTDYCACVGMERKEGAKTDEEEGQ